MIMTFDNTKIIRARDVMKKGILTIDGMATAKEAAAKMRTENRSSIMVEKRHPDDAWGMVVVNDFIKGVILENRSSSAVHVYEIMSKPVITVPADMDIRYVTRLLYNAGIGGAPVEDKGELMGMISLYSLIMNHQLF